MTEPQARIEYIDSNHLKVSFSYLIIKVESVNEKFGLLSDFAKKNNLYGYTNGRLYVFDEMVQPHTRLLDLIETVLEPIGLIQHRDYALGYEQLTRGVKYQDSNTLDEDLPDLAKSEWLGSILKPEGNFIWYRDLNDWKSYSEWRNGVFRQRYIEYYQILLLKYFEEYYSDKLKFEPTVIEFRGNNLVYGLVKQSEFFVIPKDLLISKYKITTSCY